MIIYSMTASLDGYIAGPDGSFDWSAPDEELHAFHNERVRELGGHFLGRKLYETMRYWDDDDPTWGEIETDFAEIWRALPKVVFSRTLRAVEGDNARPASAGIEEEVAALPADATFGLGGAGLAAEFLRRGLVDELQLFLAPVVVGGGTPFFPKLDGSVAFQLLETRTFASRVVYLRYRRARA